MMKNLLLVIFMAFASSAAFAQPCTQLFISEYADVPSGTDGKYIEIYNPTNTAIDLANYEFWRISNGGSWPEATQSLSGNIAPLGTFVLSNSLAAVPASDLVSTGFVSWNGDDAVGLAYNGGSGTTYTLIDAVGTDGSDPGTGWDVAGTTNGTRDLTLIRKATVSVPNTNWTTSAGTTVADSEWTVLTYAVTDAGTHTSDCATPPPSCAISSLTDGASQTSCDPVNNTYSNDVTITYADAPTTGTLDVNGQSFAITTSPQTVTLVGLVSDGLAVDVTATFSDDLACTSTATGLFTAPASCATDTEAPVLSNGCNTVNANDALFDPSWDNGDATPAGFGDWILTTSNGNPANAGHFIGTSPNVDVSAEAFGLYANSGQQSDAILPFDGMEEGSELSLLMENGFIDNGGVVGFSLQNASGENLWEFFFIGGNSNFQVNDAAGTSNTTLPYTSDGLSVSLVQDGATSLMPTISFIGSATTWTPASSSALINPVSGDQVIDRIRLFNFNAGNGGNFNAYFNSIEVCNVCPADITADCGDVTNLSITGQPTAVDNVDPSPTVTFADVSVSNPLGCDDLLRTWTATDGLGNFSTCEQTISVTDMIAPVLQCQDFAVTLDGSGAASITPADVTLSVSDNCTAVVDTTLNQTTFDCTDAENSPVTVTLTATDDCGNFTTCTALVTITPSLACSNCAFDLIVDGGNQSTCDPLTDTYSNDVTITFTDAPTTGTLDVNGQSFAIGTSPQTVTLTGLISDGAAVDIAASFSDQPTCSGSATALFTAPASCFNPCGTGQTNLVYDDFEGGTDATTVAPSTYNTSGDVWALVSDLGPITAAHQGSDFWAMQDLNNGNGGGNFNHELVYDLSYAAASYSDIEVSFWYNTTLNSTGDIVGYKYTVDGGVETTVTFTGNTNGWVEATFSIPLTPASTTAQVKLFGSFDGGSDYAGFDLLNICGVDLIPSTCSVDGLTAGTQTACSLVDNTYTQEVIVTYTDAPAAGDLDVNGQIFAITTSPQTVVLTGLVSDGLDVDVTAFFTDDIFCTTTATALFTAPADCTPANTIVINEVDYNPEGTDNDEFIELYNAGTLTVNLSNYTIEQYSGASASLYNTLTLANVTLAPGDYYVIGSATVPNVDQIEYTSNGIQNGDTDALALLRSGVIVDALSYDGDVIGIVEGSSATEDDGDGFKALIRFPDGTDTDDNSLDFQLTCATPGAANIVCPDNDTCADAQFITSTPISGWENSVTGTLLNSAPDILCGGTGDNAVWYEFEAMSAATIIYAGVNTQTVPGFPTGFDAVIEVFDGCNGTSLGCFDNYGPDEVERVFPGNLVTGDTYFYAVYHDSSEPAPTQWDFTTHVAGFIQGDIRPVFCGRTDYELSDIFTPERQDLGQLYQTNIPVSGYAVELTDQVTGLTYYHEQFGFNAQYFGFNEFPGLPFNSTFDARTRHLIGLTYNGLFAYFWSDYGNSCTLGVQGVTQTNLRPEYCNASTQYHLGDFLLADQVPAATEYEFRFDDGTNVIERTDNNYSIALRNVSGLLYNTTYTVQVRARVNGVWGAYGTGCSIQMQPKPPTTQLQAVSCNGTVEYPSSTNLLADFVVGSDIYFFRFTPIGGGAETVYTDNNLSLLLNVFSAPNLELGSYNVAVNTFGGGELGEYGSECPVTIVAPGNLPGSAGTEVGNASALTSSSFGASIFPNPVSDGEVMLRLEDLDGYEGQVGIEIIDITGRTLSSELLSTKGSTTQFRVQLPESTVSGLYLVKIIVGDESKTLRLTVQ